MKFTRLTWLDFDEGMDRLAVQYMGLVDHVYGVPRGGLPCAVALSHRLDIPMVQSPGDAGRTDRLLIVDDIHDSGLTMREYAGRVPFALRAVWITRKSMPGIGAGLVLEVDDWFVFPWEDASKARREYENYRAARAA